MKMFLIDNVLWDCVERPNEYKLEVSEFSRRDAKARSKICLSVKELIYSVIMSTKTAAETWGRLPNTYSDRKIFFNKLRRLSNP